jgi:hypothetical protein
MTKNISKGDIQLLSWIAEYKFLTAKQLGSLSQRSRQVMRKKQRELASGNYVTIQMQTFGVGPGRPENIVLLTAKGLKFLKEKNVLSNHARYVTNKTKGSISVSHDLLVNWFFIHLIQIGREKPSLSTKHLTISSHRLKSGSSEKPLLMEPISNGQSAENYTMIPDGVFIITDKESEKSLLFFLEVDMGTETLVNSKGKPTDVRQKIINYQTLFREAKYRRYEKIFKVKLNGFRLLFLSNTPTRLKALCRLVREISPTNFIWLAVQDQMFSNGLSAEIWARGGKDNEQLQSILGHRLASKITVIDKIR